jgi:hypothetical protein
MQRKPLSLQTIVESRSRTAFWQGVFVASVFVVAPLAVLHSLGDRDLAFTEKVTLVAVITLVVASFIDDIRQGIENRRSTPEPSFLERTTLVYWVESQSAAEPDDDPRDDPSEVS